MANHRKLHGFIAKIKILVSQINDINNKNILLGKRKGYFY